MTCNAPSCGTTTSVNESICPVNVDVAGLVSGIMFEPDVYPTPINVFV